MSLGMIDPRSTVLANPLVDTVASFGVTEGFFILHGSFIATGDENAGGGGTGRRNWPPEVLKVDELVKLIDRVPWAAINRFVVEYSTVGDLDGKGGELIDISLEGSALDVTETVDVPETRRKN